MKIGGGYPLSGNPFTLITDLDGNILFVDEYASRLLRLAHGDALPSVLYPADTALLLTLLQDMAGKETSRESVFLHIRNQESGVFENYLFHVVARPVSNHSQEFIFSGSAVAKESQEEDNELIFASSLDGIVLFSEKGDVLKANPAFCSMVGCEWVELQKMNRDQLVDGGDEKWKYASRILQKTGFYKGELALLHQDGSRIETELTSKTFIGSNGERLTNMFVRDKRLQKMSETALRESEHLYRMFFYDNPMPMLVYDAASFRILEVNKKAVDYYGYDQETFLSLTITELRPEEDRDAFLERVSALSPDEPGRKSVTRHLTASGKITQVELFSYPFDYHSRKTRLILVNDVTEQKAAAEILATNEKRFRAMISDSIDGMLLTDVRAIIGFASPAVTTMLGYTEQQLIGTSCFDYIHPDDNALAKNAFQPGTDSNEVQFMELRIKHADGHWLWCYVRGHNMTANPYVKAVKLVISDITHRKQTEAALRDSEERYKAFIRQTNEGTWRYEMTEPVFIGWEENRIIEEGIANGYLAECNDAMARMYGFEKAEDVLGASIGDMVDLNQEENIEYFRNFIQSGFHLDNVESVETDRFGAKKHFLNSLVGIVEDGYLKRIWGTQRDVTEQKKTEEALQISEYRWKFALEGANQGVWDWDIISGKAYWSRRYSVMLGFEEHERIASFEEWKEMVHPDDIGNTLEALNKCLEGITEEYEAEIRMKCRDGSYKWILDRGMVVERNEDGAPTRMIGTHTDIHELKLQKDALAFSESRFKGLVQNGGDVIAIINEEGVVHYSSPTALTILGNEPASNIGKNVFEHIHPADRKWARALFDEVATGERKTTVISPYRYPHATKGYRWLETVVTDLREEPSINGFVINSRDITDRIQLETALRQYTEQLETAQRIAKLAYLEFDFRENRYMGSPEVYRLVEIDDTSTEITLELIISYVHPSEREKVYETISHILREGAGLSMEYRILLPDGRQKVVAAMGGITRDMNGDYEKFSLVLQDMTDMRSAQLALQSSENKFRYIFDNSADGIILTVPGGKVQNANDAICQMLGYSREEILQKKRKDIFDFSDENFHQNIRRPTARGRYKGELRLIHKDGHSIDAEITSVHFRDGEGKSYHSTIIRDITEKKKQQQLVVESKMELQKALLELNKLLWEKEETEKRLRISERNLRAIFSHTNESFVLIDSDLRIISFNNKAKDYFHTYLGVDMRENISYALSLPPGRREKFEERMAEVLAGKELVYEINYDHPGKRWFFVYANPVHNNQGNIAEICLTIADVTHQKIAEQQIRDTASQLSDIMETISDGMFIIDSNWNISYLNNAAEKLIAVSRRILVGKSAWGVFDEAGQTVFLRNFKKAMHEKTIVHFEEYYAPFQKWFELSAYPIGEGITVYFRDVTERKQQQMILALEKQVLEINAVEHIALNTTVHFFAKGLEDIISGAHCTVIALESNHKMKLLGAPSISEEYKQTLRELEMQKGNGSCVEAVIQKRMIFSADLAADKAWQQMKEHALEAGYQSAWSIPVLGSKENVLGCLGLYFANKRLPNAMETSILEQASNFLQIIIENKTAAEKLRISNERYIYVLKATNEAIYDWDLSTGFLFWGDGFTSLFGYQVTKEHQRIGFWESCLHPEDAPGVMKSLSAFLQANRGTLWEQEYRFLKADGSYAFVMEKGYVLTDNEGRPFRMVGSIQDLTLRKQLEIQLLNQELAKQKLVAQAAIDAQEKERAQIGKELHDNINQILTTTKLYLELAKTDEKNRMNLIARSATNIVDTIQEIRQLSRSLVPPSIGDLGLVESIADLIENVRITNLINIEFYPINIVENLIEDNLKLMLFRVVQEQINNVLKHAKAKNLIIELVLDEEVLELNISDDGIGFDFQKVKKGLGLSNIASRTNLFNGNVQILTSPGKGCKLNVTVPMDKK